MSEPVPPPEKFDFGQSLYELARQFFSRSVMLLILFTAAITSVTLYAAHAYAADMDKRIEPLRVDLAQHKAEEATRNMEVEKRLRAAEVNSLETNLNVKLLVRDYARMEPIELSHPDGGVP